MTQPPMNDDLARARSGDREALDRLLGRAQEKLTNVAVARIGAGLKARVRTSDVLQSTYLDVLRSVREFEGTDEDAFVAWVTRILENNIRDKGKYFGAKKRLEPPTTHAAEELARPHLRPVATPSAQAVRTEDLKLVSRAIDALPEDYRKVVILRMVEGCSHKEIADMLGRTEAATRMLLTRARAALALEIDALRGGGGAS